MTRLFEVNINCYGYDINTWVKAESESEAIELAKLELDIHIGASEMTGDEIQRYENDEHWGTDFKAFVADSDPLSDRVFVYDAGT